MRFMILVPADKHSEAGAMPDEQLTPELQEQERRIAAQAIENAKR